MYTYHPDHHLFEFKSHGTSGYGSSERTAYDDWLINRIYDSLSPNDNLLALDPLHKAALSRGQP